MFHAIRSTALVAALVGLVPMVASAAVVFQSAGGFSLKYDGTIKDGDPISVLLKDKVSINGAEIYVDDKLKDIGVTYLGGSDKITITFTNIHVNGLTLDLFTGASLDVKIDGQPAQGFLNSGGAWQAQTLKRICGSTEPNCDAELLTGAPDQYISSIELSGGGFIGLNNLQFLIADTGNGGNVPEPASYALAALALLAAGAASRRIPAR